MSKLFNHLSQPEGTELPVSLRALMQQLGQAAGAQGGSRRGRFFDALRAICLTVDPSLLWQPDRADLAGFLAAISSVEDRAHSGALDDESSLDALMAVLAVHGYLSPAARPVLTDRLARTLASYRCEFWQEDETSAADSAVPSDADEVVDWNALGVRLMRPAGDFAGLSDVEDESAWEAFPAIHPQGPTLH
jgi:hypothetical protein